MSATYPSVIVSALLLLACHDSPADAPGDRHQATPPVDASAAEPEVAEPKVTEPRVTEPKAPGPPPEGSGPDELHRLEGQPEAALLSEFGEPSSRREFPMAECCSEFEIELYNTYPPNAGHEAVRIRQWSWDYEGYTLTVWLHQRAGAWQVLETSRYGDDVEF